jgi:HK97 family phage prohead protease
MASPVISGFAIQWNQPAVIAGAFEERFAREAFDKSLRDDPDVAALWAHDPSRPLGRVSNGSLKLRATGVGLWYELTPNVDAPLGQEAVAMVGADTVNQVSVGFSPEIEEWDDSGDLPRRLITQAHLHELSLCLWAAYGALTSASLRSDNAMAALRRMREKMRKRDILR